MKNEIAVIGAGSTGLFTALDLKLRGFEVSLFDRSVAGSGTSGKFHGLLHSGARYAVTDSSAAIECRTESAILKRIAEHCIVDTGGLFVALSKQDTEYGEELRNSLSSCSIVHRSLDSDETIKAEPKLSPDVIESIAVPDAVLLGSDFLASLALSCIEAGVRYLPFMELQSAEVLKNEIHSLTFRKTIGGNTQTEKTDFVVNATGPWTARTSEMLGAKINIMPVAGTMLVLRDKYTSCVINRMRKPSDGDIIVPYGLHSILGTTAALIEDPDNVSVDDIDKEILIEEAAAMIPSIAASSTIRTYSSARPLIMNDQSSSEMTRSVTRDFIVRAGEETGVRNLTVVSGGKMTTSRLAGESAANITSLILGRKTGSRTASFYLTDVHSISGMNTSQSRNTEKMKAAIAALKGGIDDEREQSAIMLASLNDDLRRK